MKTVGSRAEVMHGNAKHTSGGLEKKDLKYNKSKRIVSVKKSNQSAKHNRLLEHGYGFEKGKFGNIKMDKSEIDKLKKHMKKGGMTHKKHHKKGGMTHKKHHKKGGMTHKKHHKKGGYSHHPLAPQTL